MGGEVEKIVKKIEILGKKIKDILKLVEFIVK